MKKRKRDTKERRNGLRPLVDCETVLMDSFRWAVTYTFSFSFLSWRRNATTYSKSFYKSDHLYHHGILGQKWGKRNGPPYPLGASDHSASEKKAGWRKSLDKEKKSEYNKESRSEKEPHKKRGLTDKQKRAIKIGAAVAVTALAAYGTYRLAKSGKLDKLAALGKDKVDGLLGKKSSKEFLSGSTDGIFGPNGIRKLSHAESLSDTLRNTNPHSGNPVYKNNCSVCGIAAILRRRGYNVSAKDTGGMQQNLGGIIEDCFKGAKVFDGSAVKFGRSQQDAAEMLLKRFGENAEGVCNIQWKGGSGGHVFNWVIKNGVVTFFDAQKQTDNISVYWRMINPQGYLQLARLDNVEINFDAIKKYVE